MAVWRGRRVGVDPELIFTLSFWAFVPGIIGARAFYVIEYWSGFQKATVGDTLLAMVNVTEGGLVVYGSVIGGALGLVGFFAKYKMPPLATLDLITPSFLLGLAIGRIGCLLNGCCFGGPCDLPWAVTFPAGSPPHVHQVRTGQTFLHGLKIVGDPDAEPVIAEVRPDSPAEKQGLQAGQTIAAINGRPVGTVDHAQWALIRAGRTGSEITVAIDESASVARWTLPSAPARSEPVHPTQLYSAANALVLCLFLLAYTPFRRRDGEVWAMFLTVYPVTRFLLEIIRTDEPGMFGTGLSISQNLSLLLLVGAIIFWAQLRMRPPGTVFATYREPRKRGSEAAEQ
jgi:phosphatidylglycerol:prolipoprotein diacylglycerol transferase